MAEQPAANKTSVAVTISAAQSLSNSLDLTTATGSVALMIAPDDWTPANISFQVSDDNQHFSDLFDWNGVEVLRAMGPGRALLVPADLTLAAMYLKIRSGPSANPVPQQADRTFKCVIA